MSFEHICDIKKIYSILNREHVAFKDKPSYSQIHNTILVNDNIVDSVSSLIISPSIPTVYKYNLEPHISDNGIRSAQWRAYELVKLNSSYRIPKSKMEIELRFGDFRSQASASPSSSSSRIERETENGGKKKSDQKTKFVDGVDRESFFLLLMFFERKFKITLEDYREKKNMVIDDIEYSSYNDLYLRFWADEWTIIEDQSYDIGILTAQQMGRKVGDALTQKQREKEARLIKDMPSLSNGVLRVRTSDRGKTWLAKTNRNTFTWSTRYKYDPRISISIERDIENHSELTLLTGIRPHETIPSGVRIKTRRTFFECIAIDDITNANSKLFIPMWKYDFSIVNRAKNVILAHEIDVGINKYANNSSSTTTTFEIEIECIDPVRFIDLFGSKILIDTLLNKYNVMLQIISEFGKADISENDFNGLFEKLNSKFDAINQDLVQSNSEIINYTVNDNFNNEEEEKKEEVEEDFMSIMQKNISSLDYTNITVEPLQYTNIRN